MSACVPQVIATPAPLHVTESPTVDAAPTEVDQSAGWKLYKNDIYGLSFQYPSSWFGPDEYATDEDLRIEVGSDIVYPYGTSRESRIYNLKNSYFIVIQFSKTNQNQYWKETYQSLLNLKDGGSLSDAKSLSIKVRQLNIGSLDGVEYIYTLSESAQTEWAFARQVILFDDQSIFISIMGSPNNVDVSNGSDWRDVYQMVDETNLNVFHRVVESIEIEYF